MSPRALAPKNPHAVALGRRGGAVSSPEKAAAARANGQKGGRPRKAVERRAACPECERSNGPHFRGACSH